MGVAAPNVGWRADRSDRASAARRLDGMGRQGPGRRSWLCLCGRRARRWASYSWLLVLLLLSWQ